MVTYQLLTCHYCHEPVSADSHGSYVDRTDGDGCDDSPSFVHEAHPVEFECGDCEQRFDSWSDAEAHALRWQAPGEEPATITKRERDSQ